MNAPHACPRSNDDKRWPVKNLLKDPEWSGWTDREIARRCNVGAPLVGQLRKTVTVRNYSEDRTYRTKRGSTGTMKTGKTGRTPAAVATPPMEEMAIECLGLSRKQLEDVAVGVAKVDTAPAVPAIDLHVLQ